MKLFPPPGGPSWLPPLLRSIREGLAQQWDSPVKLQRLATADLPAPADWEGGIVYDSTASGLKYSDGSTWSAIGSTGTGNDLSVIDGGSSTGTGLSIIDGGDST